MGNYVVKIPAEVEVLVFGADAVEEVHKRIDAFVHQLHGVVVELDADGFHPALDTHAYELSCISDQVGAAPSHPDVSHGAATPNMFAEESKVLEILEAADSPQEVNDRVVAIVRQLCEQVSDLMVDSSLLHGFGDTFHNRFSFSDRACRVCGCTQNSACVTEAGPCYWAEPDLCSACAADVETEQDRIYASWATKGGPS